MIRRTYFWQHRVVMPDQLEREDKFQSQQIERLSSAETDAFAILMKAMLESIENQEHLWPVEDPSLSQFTNSTAIHGILARLTLWVRTIRSPK